jgi:hypothetical protein
MNMTLQHLGLALTGILTLVTAGLPCAVAADAGLTTTVTRHDLRPLPGVQCNLLQELPLYRLNETGIS